MELFKLFLVFSCKLNFEVAAFQFLYPSFEYTYSDWPTLSPVDPINILQGKQNAKSSSELYSNLVNC